MTKITLIRHAPTGHNIEGRFMGDLDVPITLEGALLAKKLSLQLKSTLFTKYYSSPLTRTIETAKQLFPHAKIQIDNNLKERGLGLWTGMSKQSVRESYPQAFLTTGPMDPLFTPPEGEPIEHFVDRIVVFLKTVISSGGDHHLAVVTHNGVIRVLRCLIEHRPIVEIFAEWEPILQPRTYELNNLRLPTIQELIGDTSPKE